MGAVALSARGLFARSPDADKSPTNHEVMMKHPFIRLTIALLFLGAVVPGAVSPVAGAEGQADTAVAKQFLGMWRLVNWTQHGVDGATRPAPGDAGYLVYSGVNRMCAVIMDSKRPKWPDGAPATVDQAVARYSGFISYCARVEVNARDGFVLHHVDVERSPNVIGTVRKRWFKFDGPNRLTLRVDPAELGANVKDSTLVWERMQN